MHTNVSNHTNVDARQATVEHDEKWPSTRAHPFIVIDAAQTNTSTDAHPYKPSPVRGLGGRFSALPVERRTGNDTYGGDMCSTSSRFTRQTLCGFQTTFRKELLQILEEYVQYLTHRHVETAFPIKNLL
jgi:hypothetical protein